jgi:hypothetical protein
MANLLPTTSIEANNLFNVNGLVAVITGGGSGLFSHTFSSPTPSFLAQKLKT